MTTFILCPYPSLKKHVLSKREILLYLQCIHCCTNKYFFGEISIWWQVTYISHYCGKMIYNDKWSLCNWSFVICGILLVWFLIFPTKVYMQIFPDSFCLYYCICILRFAFITLYLLSEKIAVVRLLSICIRKIQLAGIKIC